MRNPYYVIRDKMNCNYVFVNSEKSILGVGIEECSSWKSEVDVLEAFNELWGISPESHEVFKVTESTVHTFTPVEVKPKLSEVLAGLSKIQIQVLVESGLAVGTDEPAMKFIDGDTYADVRAFLSFIHTTVDKHPRKYPNIKNFIRGNTAFALELSKLQWYIDEDGDLHAEHDTDGWTFFELPECVDSLAVIIDDLLHQYTHNHGVWDGSW